MKRWTLNILTGLSLLLCAAVVMLWVRSYWLTDQINWRNAGGWRYIRSARGQVELGFLLADWSSYWAEYHRPKYQRDEARAPQNWLVFMNGSPGDVFKSWERAGFAWHQTRNVGQGTLIAIGVAPFWSIAAIVAALPATRLLLFYRHRRRLHAPGFPVEQPSGADLNK